MTKAEKKIINININNVLLVKNEINILDDIDIPLILNSAGIIQTSDYASNEKGWRLSPANGGEAEFQNVKIRDRKLKVDDCFGFPTQRTLYNQNDWDYLVYLASTWRSGVAPLSSSEVEMAPWASPTSSCQLPGSGSRGCRSRRARFMRWSSSISNSRACRRRACPRPAWSVW